MCVCVGGGGWSHIMPMQDGGSQSRFVIALFRKAATAPCTTCVPRADNECSSHNGPFPKLNKDSSAQCGSLVYIGSASTQNRWVRELRPSPGILTLASVFSSVRIPDGG
jgi:hypothetical protein